jgi:hypothetical protein
VSSNTDDPKSWILLANIVLKNRNFREYFAITKMALQIHPDNSDLRKAFLIAIGLNPKFKKGINYYSTLIKNKKVPKDEYLILASLIFSINPNISRDIYHKIISVDASNVLSKQGLRAVDHCLKVKKKPVIGFVITHDFHRWIFESIFNALEAHGLTYMIVNRACLLSLSQVGVVILADPNPTIISEIQTLMPETVSIYTTHGVSLNGKNFAIYGSASCDYFCVTSQPIAKDLRSISLIQEERFWMTGYPQMDHLFSKIKEKETAYKKKKKDMSESGNLNKTVLVSSTYNKDFGLAYHLGSDPVSLIRGQNEKIKIIFSLHPHIHKINPKLALSWKKIAKETANVEIYDGNDMNTMDLLPEADLLISDVSSIAISFLALNKPFIRVILPSLLGTSLAIDTKELEEKINASSYTISDINLLSQTVNKLLFNEEPKNILESRRALRDYYFGDLTDGRAGDRIVEKIKEVLAL